MTVTNGNPSTGPLPALHAPKAEPWPTIHRVLLDPDLADRVAAIREARAGESPRHRAGHPAAVPVPDVAPAEQRLPLLSRLFLAGGTTR